MEMRDVPTPPRQAQSSHLLDLPTELRNQIYHAAFAQQVVAVHARDYRLPGIITACRQTLADALAMYYAVTRFRCLGEDATVAWLAALAPYLRTLVRDVRYDTRWIIVATPLIPVPGTECRLFNRLLHRLAARGVKLPDGVVKVNFYACANVLGGDGATDGDRVF